MTTCEFPEVGGVRFAFIPGSSVYAVGDDGSVWSRATRNKTRKPGWYRASVYRRPYGAKYCVVGLRADDGRGKVITRYVHRLVLEVFSGPCPPGMVACHNDGDTSNNQAGNLRWDTDKANAQDRLKHGTQTRGEKHGAAKLTAERVQAIRSLVDAGFTHKAVAGMFGVHRQTVGDIVRMVSWKHVA